MKDLHWELGVLLDNYADKVKEKDIDYSRKEEIERIYATAILLNVEKYGYGLVLPIDDFSAWVSGGSINNYDGCGDLLNAEGEEMGEVICDTKFIEGAKNNGACYVAWFNK